ncbi:MAG: hypothetical protein WEA99_11765, partial [Brumimicrobium sp.]
RKIICLIKPTPLNLLVTQINLGRFSIGAEYSLRTFRNIVGTPQYRWHYIGVVIGGRFGRFKSN